MKKYLAILGLVALSISACAITLAPTPIGGSKADGTIHLAYEFGAFQVPKIDWGAANQRAADRCRAWGYRSAESFGGGMKQCTMPDPNIGCARWRVTVTYQCMD